MDMILSNQNLAIVGTMLIIIVVQQIVIVIQSARANGSTPPEIAKLLYRSIPPELLSDAPGRLIEMLENDGNAQNDRFIPLIRLWQALRGQSPETDPELTQSDTPDADAPL